MGAVTFEGVGKVYADGTRAVSGMDLEIADGEFMVLAQASKSLVTSPSARTRAPSS